MEKHMPGIIPVACWDHARRYFDASDEHPSASAEALAYIKRLYKIERGIKEASVEERANWNGKAKPCPSSWNSRPGWKVIRSSTP
ncbi:MAG: transposase [Verrucomicrobiales bacterium]